MEHKDLVAVQQARELVEAAHAAQIRLAEFDQAKIDRICAAMARAALLDAARLGALAVEETGYGIAADKTEKNRFAAEDVWNYFRNLRTVGRINESKDVVEIASPRGVIAGIIPSTNPTSTAIFKCLIAIKSRNAIVLSPHPSAAKCINETVKVMRDAGVKEGLPTDAVACMTTATVEGTEALMKHKRTAVILATGGLGLVRAAYSSGKPAFGVGPGNVPVFIERTAHLPIAVQNILTGKCFDNGTICASEQAIVADAPIAQLVREQLKLQGAHFLKAGEADQLAKVVATAQRSLNPAIVGKSVQVIAQMAGLTIPPDTRCLVAEVGGVGRDYPLSMEKLSPILAFYVEDGLARGAARCFEILSYGGMGHTAGIHTSSREAAVQYGAEMPASRIIVNSPTTHGAIGFSTALPPSMTLGCGSWGGNVTSDNVSPLHLMDIKRVAFETRPVKSARPAQVAPQTAISNASSALAATTNNQREANGNSFSTRKLDSPAAGTIDRAEIAAIVDRFLANRLTREEALPPQNASASSFGAQTFAPLHVTNSPAPVQPLIDLEANRSDDTLPAAPHAEAAPNATNGNGNNAANDNSNTASVTAAPPPIAPSQTLAPSQPSNASQNAATAVTRDAATNGAAATAATTNGDNNRRVVDFVCEDDVRRALTRNEKIYVNARTIITPAARDAGEAAEVFAKA